MGNVVAQKIGRGLMDGKNGNKESCWQTQYEDIFAVQEASIFLP